MGRERIQPRQPVGLARRGRVLSLAVDPGAGLLRRRDLVTREPGLVEERTRDLEVVLEHHDPMTDDRGVVRRPSAAVAVDGAGLDPTGFQRGHEHVGLEPRGYPGELDNLLVVAMIVVVVMPMAMELHNRSVSTIYAFTRPVCPELKRVLLSPV